MRRAFGGFKTGFLSPLRGLALAFRNQRIRKLMLFPFLISVAVFVIGSVLGASLFFAWFLPMLTVQLQTFDLQPGSLSYFFVYWLLLLLSLPAGLFGLFYFLFLTARLVATPIYGQLAERALIETGLMPERPFAVGDWMRTNAHLLGVAILKLGAFAAVGVVLFALSFIPGAALFTAFGFLLMAAFDVVDLSFEALRMGFRERFTIFRTEFPAFAGLAAMLGLVFLVPGLNFFLFPAAIVGGSEIVRISRL